MFYDFLVMDTVVDCLLKEPGQGILDPHSQASKIG